MDNEKLDVIIFSYTDDKYRIRALLLTNEDRSSYQGRVTGGFYTLKTEKLTSLSAGKFNVICMLIYCIKKYHGEKKTKVTQKEGRKKVRHSRGRPF